MFNKLKWKRSPDEIAAEAYSEQRADRYKVKRY